MLNALHIAKTGLDAQRQFVDTISNNIANVNTPGYKRAVVEFSGLATRLNESEKLSGKSPGGLALHGVRITQVKADYRVGPLKATGNELDLAIQGDGLLEIEMPNGSRGFTRIGRLALDRNGYLVTNHGYRLAASIAVPPHIESIQIQPDGLVIGESSGGAAKEELGQLQLAKFLSPDALQDRGDGVYVASSGAGNAIYGLPGEEGFGATLHKYIEESNVDMTAEMIELMIAQRGYQLNARLLQIANQIVETTTNLFQGGS